VKPVLVLHVNSGLTVSPDTLLRRLRESSQEKTTHLTLLGWMTSPSGADGATAHCWLILKSAAH